MTKTLTEQWREGTLESGWYYVVIEWNDEIRMLYFEGDYFLDTDVPLDNDNIKEVLDAVPSYEEYMELVSKCRQLEKRLAIATKALKEYAEIETDDWIDSQEVARKALKKMKGVK